MGRVAPFFDSRCILSSSPTVLTISVPIANYLGLHPRTVINMRYMKLVIAIACLLLVSTVAKSSTAEEHDH